MNREQPRISVGMPVYNGEPYLKEALDSLLTQTYDELVKSSLSIEWFWMSSGDSAAVQVLLLSNSRDLVCSNLLCEKVTLAKPNASHRVSKCAAAQLCHLFTGI